MQLRLQILSIVHLMKCLNANLRLQGWSA